MQLSLLNVGRGCRFSDTEASYSLVNISKARDAQDIDYIQRDKYGKKQSGHQP